MFSVSLLFDEVHPFDLEGGREAQAGYDHASGVERQHQNQNIWLLEEAQNKAMFSSIPIILLHLSGLNFRMREVTFSIYSSLTSEECQS